jgi:hypothetical protein
VAAIEALDRTPYFPDEIHELALMDDRYVLKMVFDVHDFAKFQYKYFGTFCSCLVIFRILFPDPQINESMSISCGVENKFVLLQNVIMDHVSRK